MKGSAMKLALFLLVLVVVAGVALAWSSRRDPGASLEPLKDPASIASLESRIPYDIRVTSAPPSWCDPVDLHVDFVTDASGSVIGETWTVMDGDSPQMAFVSFDDLYFRCDGPDCFRITLRQNGASAVLFVTLK